jgi:UDPglucose--hexose-1-phosphate uridylyltransferase
MWVNQAPRGAVDGWMSIEIVSPWRARGVARYIAAAEVAGEEYFNPVDPADVAGRLRDLAK